MSHRNARTTVFARRLAGPLPDPNPRRRLSGSRVMRCAVPVGIAAAAVQVVSLLR